MVLSTDIKPTRVGNHSSKIKISAYDKFVKQYRIETVSTRVQNGLSSDLSIIFQSLDTAISITVTGTGRGNGVLSKDDQLIFLFTNDSTCTAYSKEMQGYPGNHTGEGYRHEYKISYDAVTLIKSNMVKSIRTNKTNGYADTNVKQNAAESLSQLADAFLNEYNTKVLKQ